MTVTHLADHSALLALPAFAPALIIAGVIVVMVVRDRRKPDDPLDEDPTAADGDTAAADAADADQRATDPDA